ncbi:MAG: phosphotransferase [Actinomycetes bacterium]
MPRSAYVLAALATAAVRGLHPVSARGPEVAGADFDVAVVDDVQRRRWVVRAPRHAAAGAALESELRLLAALGDRDRSGLRFDVPRVAGSAPLPEGGRAVVYPYLDGAPLHPGELRPGPGLAAELGRALASLHDAPLALAESAGVPVYDPREYRERRLAEVDRAAQTGHVPTRLLTRWEKLLEDVGRWRFQPSLVHGDLVAEHVLVADGRVVGMLDWGEARVADPADDLAWVAVGADADALDSVLESYAVARREQPDRHLATRARLAGELALARWLLHGTTTGDAHVVDDAVQMLRDLDADVGGAAL